MAVKERPRNLHYELRDVKHDLRDVICVLRDDKKGLRNVICLVRDVIRGLRDVKKSLRDVNGELRDAKNGLRIVIMPLRQLSIVNGAVNVINKHLNDELDTTFSIPILYEVELRYDKGMYMKFYKIIFLE